MAWAFRIAVRLLGSLACAVAGFLVFLVLFIPIGFFVLPDIDPRSTIAWLALVLSGAMGAAAAVMMAMAASSNEDRWRGGFWALVVGAILAAYLLGLMSQIGLSPWEERPSPWGALLLWTATVGAGFMAWRWARRCCHANADGPLTPRLRRSRIRLARIPP